MFVAAIALALILTGIAAYQLLISIIFYFRISRQNQPANISDDQFPTASVLLALRGADPELAAGIRQLLHQDYPDIDLRLMIDSEEDPAWQVVSEIQEEIQNPKLAFSPLSNRPKASSLHCASMVQLMEELPDDREVIVLVDGDVVGYDGFLRTLISPIANGEADAAHGNRWYAPNVGKFGSMVRYVWNAAAVLTMYFGGIPWGGMFAARAKDIRETSVVDRWRKAMAVDACVTECLKTRGIQSQFVPSLIIVNREDCSLVGNQKFIIRQLLWTRLYQPRGFWWLIVTQAYVVSLGLILALAVAIFAAAAGDHQILGVSGLAIVLYQWLMFVSLFVVEFGVRRILEKNHQPLRWLTPSKIVKLVIAIPITQFVHAAAVTSVILKKRLIWRGVEYQINQPFDVELVADRPFEQQALSGESIQ